jgi:hypothetical protein
MVTDHHDLYPLPSTSQAPKANKKRTLTEQKTNLDSTSF